MGEQINLLVNQFKPIVSQQKFHNISNYLSSVSEQIKPFLVTVCLQANELE